MVDVRTGILTVLIGSIFGGAVIFGLDYKRIKSSLVAAEKEKAELQAQIDYGKEKLRLKELELNSTMERLKNDLRRKNNLYESQRASNDVAVNSLLKHIEDLRVRIETANADTARAIAGRTGAVLGDCAKEYNRVAAEAERLKIKIEGLQATVKACRID